MDPVVSAETRVQECVRRVIATDPDAKAAVAKLLAAKALIAAMSGALWQIASIIDHQLGRQVESGIAARDGSQSAGDRLLDRALGRPTQAFENPEEGEVKRTLIVRWMPPDPNDRSNVIEPEPD
jgi:hypothetical protein